MTPEQLEGFVGPESKAPLHVEDSRVIEGHVASGRLVGGAEAYAIHDFIPRFVPPDNYARNFGLQWQVHRETQLDSFTGATYSRDRLFATTKWPSHLPGQRILEAGSGAGRFTEILAATGADIYSFDYSEAVVANHATNGRHANVHIFQADIYRIPFVRRSFDKVICLGVLQHTPDVASAFRSLAEMVRPGGELVVDAYPRRLRSMLHWKYVVRPLTTRLPPKQLYRLVSWYAPRLIPAARLARSLAGRAGHRLVPILDQSDKDVSIEVQQAWTVLDTYDALSARFDSPQRPARLKGWFEQCGFEEIEVLTDVPSACALVGRGRRPT